jgi:uncharacterized membrane protein
MTWIFYAFGAAFFFTAMALLQRIVAIETKNPRAATFVLNFYAIILSFIIYFITGAYKNFALPNEPIAWVYAAIAILLFGLSERLRFIVSKLLDASVNAIIGNVYILVSFIGALFLYSESASAIKLIGAALIILALFIVSYTKKTTRNYTLKGILLGILFETFVGLAGMLDKKGVQYFNPQTYNIFVWLFPLLVIIFPYIKIKDIVSEFKLGSWKIIIVAAFNVLGYLFLLKAFELSEATRVIPIVQTSTLFTVLFGIILLKERENIARKIIGGILAVIGIYFLIAIV